jgi:hypothetical protein
MDGSPDEHSPNGGGRCRDILVVSHLAARLELFRTAYDEKLACQVRNPIAVNI